MFELLLVAAEEALFFAGVLFSVVFVFRAQEIHGECGNDGARPHVGRQHGEDHGFGERNEEVFRHA